MTVTNRRERRNVEGTLSLRSIPLKEPLTHLEEAAVSFNDAEYWGIINIIDGLTFLVISQDGTDLKFQDTFPIRLEHVIKRNPLRTM